MSAQELAARTAAAILSRRSEIAAAFVGLEFSRHPDLEQRYRTLGREKSQQDAGHHLSFLAQALTLNNQALFVDYIAWVKVLLVQRKVSASDLSLHLECLAETLRDGLPEECGALAAEFVLAGADAVPILPDDMPTFLREGTPLSPLAHQYFEALRRGDRYVASRLVLDAVAAGTPVKDIYLFVFQPAQQEIGRLWQTNRISVAQEHYCTAATQLIMSQLYPYIFTAEKKERVLVATCVAGDLHEIGVRMVADFFEMDGWDTYYLGANTPHAAVIESLIEHHADVLAVSATISYHVEAVRELIQAVRRVPAVSSVKILAGGYPFNQDPILWQTIGADGGAWNAQQAILLANQLVTRVAA